MSNTISAAICTNWVYPLGMPTLPVQPAQDQAFQIEVEFECSKRSGQT